MASALAARLAARWCLLPYAPHPAAPAAGCAAPTDRCARPLDLLLPAPALQQQQQQQSWQQELFPGCRPALGRCGSQFPPILPVAQASLQPSNLLLYLAPCIPAPFCYRPRRIFSCLLACTAL